MIACTSSPFKLLTFSIAVQKPCFCCPRPRESGLSNYLKSFVPGGHAEQSSFERRPFSFSVKMTFLYFFEVGWLWCLPSRKGSHVPPNGQDGKSSTQKCKTVGDMWSFPGEDTRVIQFEFFLLPTNDVAPKKRKGIPYVLLFFIYPLLRIQRWGTLLKNAFVANFMSQLGSRSGVGQPHWGWTKIIPENIWEMINVP